MFTACGRASDSEETNSNGGRLGAGGTPSGGVVSSGGANEGGSSTGGRYNGNAAAGGASTGGRPTGGVTGASTGGHSASGGSGGGLTSTGGRLAGGVTGASTGGNSASGGVAEGGASGATAGGESAGGESSCVDTCTRYGSACCVPTLDCVKPGRSCVFEVLATSVGVIYEYEDLVQKMATIPQDKLLSFDDADIESALAEPPPSARIELHLTADAGAAYGAALAQAWAHPFRLSCNGELQYVGVVYDAGGQAALRTPVLQVAPGGGAGRVLRLAAWQSAWFLTGSDDPLLRQRLESTDFRAALCYRGALGELEPRE